MGQREAPGQRIAGGASSSSSKSSFSLFHQNICGVRTNKELLEIHLESENHDIICLSEHNLSQEQFSSFCLHDYTNLAAFCCKSRRKGGVCILAKSDIKSTNLDVSQFCSEDSCHLAAAKILLSNQDSVIILGVYRIPDHNCDEFFELLGGCLDFILQGPHKIVVLGDFNINILSNDLSSTSFLHIMRSYGLHHKISSYTREFKNSKTVIDNIFTNVDSRIINCRVVGAALSDHHGQEAVIDLSPSPLSVGPRFIESRKFTSENIHCFRYHLKKETWVDMLGQQSADLKFSEFLRTMIYYYEISFPITKTKIKPRKSSNKPVVTPEILNLKKQLQFLYTLSKDLGSSHPVRSRYRDVRRNFRMAVRMAKSDKVLSGIAGSSNKSKTIWNIINDT